MYGSAFKYIIAILLFCFVISCSKKEDDTETFYKSSFDQKGKTFCFEEYGPMNGVVRSVCVSIPENATHQMSTFEHYIFVSNDNDLLYYQVNAMFGDAVLLRSSATQLDTAALIVMPYYLNTIFSTSYYVPHKIKTDGKTDLLQVLNDTLNWQPISTYTLNTTDRTVSFYTKDLNAMYALGSRK